MSEKNDGGPAFPVPLSIGPGYDTERASQYNEGGMSLRDWFAGQALAGILASAPHFEGNVPILAKDAYRVADAMLEARKR